MVLAVAAVLAAVAAPAEPPAVPDDVWLFRDRPVGTVRIEGLADDVASGLRDGLALAADEAVLYPSVLEADLRRARLFLARHGHGEPRVRVSVVPHWRGRKVDVTFVVESRPVLVERLEFDGTPPGFERAERDLRRQLVGKAFTDRSADSAAATLRKELRENGWALAEVGAAVARTAGGGAGLKLRARPGNLYWWGDTVVQGVPDDLAGLAVRVADLERGRLYSSKDVERAEDNLRLLGLFGRLRLDAEPVAPDTLEMRIDVGQRKPRTVKTGLGYWTDEGIRGGAQWEHRNFFGGGRSFGAGGVASQYRQEGFVSARWPALIAPRVWTELRLSVKNATEENYDQLETGASLGNRWWFTTRSSLFFGASTSRVQVNGRLPDFDGERDDFVFALPVDLRYDGSDDVLRPARGRKLAVSAEWAPAGVSGNEYVIGEIEGVQYFRLPLRSVLTARVLAGVAHRLGRTESLLPDRRFYSGGASSHRGFGRRLLGPLDSAGNPIGGEAVLNASLDLRFPLWRALRGAVFVDAGQVWFRPTDVQPGDLEVAVGPGLWFDTPVGPFRFDVGFRVTDVSPAPRSAYHLAIGVPF